VEPTSVTETTGAVDGGVVSAGSVVFSVACAEVFPEVSTA
jgi:hypothetical protein